MIGLREAADRLGLHYMTVYRYVRTGRLAASKDGAEWRVDPKDVNRLAATAVAPPKRTGQRSWATGRLEDRMVAGDEQGAWSLVESVLAAGADPADVHLELIAPTLVSIGDKWASGELDVGDEHRASVIAKWLIARMGSRFVRRGRKRGVVVVGAVAGERHDIPVSIVADQLRGAGFEVVDFGADTPAGSFAVAAVHYRPIVVMVGATMRVRRSAVARAVAAVRASASTAVLVGGAAIESEEEAHELGADGWTGADARRAVEAVETLASK